MITDGHVAFIPDIQRNVTFYSKNIAIGSNF